MPSPMCPRLLGYTRYLPEGPPALLDVHAVAFTAVPLGPHPTPIANLSPSFCLSTPSELVSPKLTLDPPPCPR